jgi:hypothetical protein
MSANPVIYNHGELVSLDPLVNLLADDMKAVNAMILQRLASDVPLIPELAGHLIAAGGKRIRPMMTLAGAQIAGGSVHAVGLATAVEFIHSATLLHDDVIDKSNLRRGRDTANTLWGNEASVLVGDFLFARAFELMVEAGNITVLGQLAKASARITEGEIKQMTIAGMPNTPQDAYLDVITGKTAILFAAAAAAGATLVSANWSGCGSAGEAPADAEDDDEEEDEEDDDDDAEVAAAPFAGDADFAAAGGFFVGSSSSSKSAAEEEPPTSWMSPSTSATIGAASSSASWSALM